jgi:hypothetical protein
VAAKPDDGLDQLSIGVLKTMCKQQHKPCSGKKEDLIATLRAPPLKPSILARKLTSLYVPQKVNSNNVAMLVALLLHDPENKGLPKEDIVRLSDASGIGENPFAGGTTQTGPFIYSGWAGMDQLKSGEIPLVIHGKGKFRLSAADKERGGLAVAADLHTQLHELEVLGDSCRCRGTAYSYRR